MIVTLAFIENVLVLSAANDFFLLQVNLGGKPWCYKSFQSNYQGCILLLGLLETFADLGWRIMCSADVSSKYVMQETGPDYPTDAHSWYFMYDESFLYEQQELSNNTNTTQQLLLQRTTMCTTYV